MSGSEGNIYDEMEEELFEMIADRVGKGNLVLDVGCGECRLANRLASERGCKVTGVDIRDSGFFTARREAEGLDVSDLVECRRMDAGRLTSFLDESFDTAVSVYALHEFEQPLEVLSEVRKVLRPAGKMILIDFLKGSTAERLWSERYYTTREIKGMMKKAGFGTIRLSFPRERELVFVEASKKGERS